MDLNFVKSYLRVDFDDDDEFIALLISAAEEYIINSVGYYSEEKALMRLLALTLISQMYEKRSFSLNDNEKKQEIVRSIVLQLQLDDCEEGHNEQ